MNVSRETWDGIKYDKGVIYVLKYDTNESYLLHLCNELKMLKIPFTFQREVSDYEKGKYTYNVGIGNSCPLYKASIEYAVSYLRGALDMYNLTGL